MRRFILVLFILLAFNLPTYAQDGSIALYDSLSGEVVRVSSSGAVLESTIIPKPEGTVAPPNIAISSTGAITGFVAYGQPSYLMLSPSGAAPVTIPLPEDMTTDSLGFVASPALFTSDENLFAFSYGQSSGAWRIAVFDRRTNWEPIASLDQNATIPNLAPLNVQGRGPIVQSLDDQGNVTFVLAEPFSGYQVNFETSYIWNIYTGEIISTGTPTAIEGDSFNGEFLTARFDSTLPNNAGAFAYPQANALYLTSLTGERQLIFNTANLSMFWSRFISNGMYILVGGYSPENRVSWLILDRSGNVIGDFPPLQMTGVVGTASGFVYTVDAGANQGSLLYSVQVDAAGAAAAVELWAGPTNASYRVIWSGG